MDKKRITTDKCVRICDERVNLEGNITLPYEVSDLSSVVDICGCAEIVSTATETERVIVCGRARYTVLYLTKTGVLDSFDSECGFEQVIMSENLLQGMKVSGNVKVLQTSWRYENEAIELRSELSVSLIAAAAEDFEILAVLNNEDIQYDTVTAETVQCGIKNIKAYVNHDLRIPQNLPEAKKVLIANAHADITEIRKDIDQIIVEGELFVNLAYESTDQNAPMQVMNQAISFGEIVKEALCGEDSVIFADVSVDNVGTIDDTAKRIVEVFLNESSGC